MTTKLTPEEKVPALNLPLVDGGSFDLAADAPEHFSMLVFYRGYHCPVCKGYLENLNRLVRGYRDAGFSVTAVSMDDRDRAEKTRAEWDIPDVPLAYSLDEATARTWGLWVSTSIKEAESAVFNEPGLFWVRPDGRLYLADISNMPFARPDLEFLLSKAAMATEKGYPARGTRAAA